DPLVAGGGLPDQQGDATSRAQRRNDVGKSGRPVTEEHRSKTADREVEGRGVEGVYLRVGPEELDVREAFGACPPSSFGQHRLGEVYSERRPVPREPCRVTSRLTGAATDVEHTIGRGDRVRFEKASPNRAKVGVVLVGKLGPLIALRAVPGVCHIDVGNRLTHTTLSWPLGECRCWRSTSRETDADSRQVFICAARRLLLP